MQKLSFYMDDLLLYMSNPSVLDGLGPIRVISFTFIAGLTTHRTRNVQRGWIWSSLPLNFLFILWFAPNSIWPPQIWAFNRALDLFPTVKENHLFLPSCADLTFQAWSDKGITTFKDLYNQGTFMAFSELSQKFDFPKSHLFPFFSSNQAFYLESESQVS